MYERACEVNIGKSSRNLPQADRILVITKAGMIFLINIYIYIYIYIYQYSGIRTKKAGAKSYKVEIWQYGLGPKIAPSIARVISKANKKICHPCQGKLLKQLSAHALCVHGIQNARNKINFQGV